MPSITVHRTYCERHAESDHYLDERGRCHGASRAKITASGYTYTRHIGGGWYEYRPTLAIPLPLDWQMALDAHTSIGALEVEF